MVTWRAAAGSEVTEELFATVGDAWDVDERARSVLDGLGLTHIGLDRRGGEVSGGEAVLLGLAAQLVRRPDVLLLDEPTNNPDLAGTRQLAQALTAYRGALLVAGHDLPFLHELGITRWPRLDGDVTDIDPPPAS